jgi:hypothetical protein
MSPSFWEASRRAAVIRKGNSPWGAFLPRAAPGAAGAPVADALDASRASSRKNTNHRDFFKVSIPNLFLA